MKRMFWKGTFRWTSLILVILMAINLLPISAMAVEPTGGTGTESQPYVYEVGTKEDLLDAVSAINSATETDFFVIKLTNDIEMNSGLTFNRNVTLLGDGHEIYINVIGNSAHINIGNGAVVIFGSPDGSDTLTIRGIGGAGKSGADGPGFVHISGNSTLNMYKGVTLRDYTANNYYGGGVTVYQGTFHMYGGTIENCGVRYGSNCYGGGVGVLYGSQFIMDDGTIKNCFVEGNYGSTWYYPHTSGGGVFVGIGASFIMNDGSIENCSAVIDPNYRNNDAATGGGVSVAASYESYKKNGLGYLDASFEMNGGSVSGNSADIGGGISVLGTCTVNRTIAAMEPAMEANPVPDGFRVNGGTISNNTAEMGGGISLFYIRTSDGLNGTPKIDTYIKNARITGNHATDDIGGGICVTESYTALQVENCRITGNTAVEGGGIGISGNANGGTTIMNTTISENKAEGDGVWGGGVVLYGNSQLSFDERCLIYDNTAGTHEPASGGGDDLYKDASSTVIGLPEMKCTIGENQYDGWYWDYDEAYHIDGENGSPSFDYPDGASHPKKRYDASNAVAYTPVASETAERFLKVVKVANFSVQFDKNCTDIVSGIPDTQSVTPNQTASEPDAPKREGYVFGGWYTDPECTILFDFDTPVTGNIILYAKWLAILTVTFDSQGGSEVESQSVLYNTQAAKPENPFRYGYTFGGWYTDPECTTAFDFATPVTEDITLYAKWNKIVIPTYPLNYESNGGTRYNTEYYTYGVTVALTKVPTREGYTFTGWYADEALTQKITEIKMTGPKTVYAGWRATTVPEMLNGDEHFAYIIGYTDGLVRPNANISRAEAATVFFRLLKDEIRDSSLTDQNAFDDVDSDAWYNKAVSTMAALGIVKGRTATTFEPDAMITRAELATICARFDTSIRDGNSDFSDISGHWAQEDIQRAATLGWITGYPDGTFRPDQTISRAEAMTMINRVLQRLPETEADLLDDMTVWPDNQPNDWFYLAVQEATNSHKYRLKGEIYEHWTEMTEDPDWERYQN